MTTIDRRRFVDALSSRPLDPSALPAPIAAVLTRAGVSGDELRAIAGDDHVIHGAREAERLYDRLVELEARTTRSTSQSDGQLDHARALWEAARTTPMSGLASMPDDGASTTARTPTTGLSSARALTCASAAAIMPRVADGAVTGAAALGAMGIAGTVVGLGEHLDKVPKIPPSVAQYGPGLGAAGTALGSAASAGRVAAGVADLSRRGATPDNVGEITGGALGVVGAVAGPVAKALSTGFAIGQWIDKNAGISDAIARLANPSDDGLDVALPRLSALRPWADRDARVRDLVDALEQYAAYEDRAARAINTAARSAGGRNVAHLVPSAVLRAAGHEAARAPLVEACRSEVEARGVPAPIARPACEAAADEHVRPPRALRDRIVALARALQREAEAARAR